MKQEKTIPIPELSNEFASVIGSKKKSISNRAKASKNSSPRITLRLTDDEYAQLKHLSEGMTVSAYIRKCAFGDQASKRKRRSYLPVQDQASLAKALALLGQSRISNNLNQLAHQANMGLLLIDEGTQIKIDKAYSHIISMRDELIKALGLVEKK